MKQLLSEYHEYIEVSTDHTHGLSIREKGGDMIHLTREEVKELYKTWQELLP